MQADSQEAGLRERKRQETFVRIGEASLRLFVEQGYEHTTLEQIAEAAGISRRTFFSYFKAKDDVLVGLQCDGFVQALVRVFDGVTQDDVPFDVVAKKMPELAASFETPETILITGIMKSSDALRVRKQAGYVEMETALLEAMMRTWPEPTMRPGLTMVATATISVLRLALDQWYAQGADRPIGEYLNEGFAMLRQSVGGR
jgi:AcrR family transcriptional regulator